MKILPLCAFLVKICLITNSCFTQTFSENFDGFFPPTGWAVFDNGVGTGVSWSQNATSFAGAGAAYCNFDCSVPSNSEDWLVTPLVAITAGNSNLSYYHQNPDPTVWGSIYEVRVSTTSQTNSAAFTRVDSLNETLVPASWGLHSVDLSSYIGQSIYIAFVHTQNCGDDYYIDELVIGPTPCLPPSNLATANITATSVDISWTGIAPYGEISVVPTGNMPAGGGIYSTSPATIGGLMGASPYDAYVREICKGGSELLITGVFDGPLIGGQPKAIELYVQDSIPDLSVYAVGSANNGGGTTAPAGEFTFPAISVSAGTYIQITSDSADFVTYFGTSADYVGSVAFINGDDAVELIRDGVVIDVFGVDSVDGTGQSWEYLDGWAYRKDNRGANGGVFVDTNWVYSGINAVDGCTVNSSCSSIFPIGTFSGSFAASAWIGPVSFTTACPGPLLAPWIESFDNNTLPGCWSETFVQDQWRFSTGAGWEAASAGDHTGNGGNYAWLDGSVHDDGEIATLSTPQVITDSLNFPELSYWIFSNNTNDSTAHNTLLVDFYDGAAWHRVDSIRDDLGPNWIERIIPIDTFNITGPVQARFTNVGSPGNSFYNDLLIDDVDIRERPCPNSLSAFGYAQSGLSVSFTDTNPNPVSWFWDFGDGNTSIQSNPVHQYTNPGNYIVCLTATYPCGTRTFCDSVLVSQSSPSLITYTPSGNQFACQGDSTTMCFNVDVNAPSLHTGIDFHSIAGDSIFCFYGLIFGDSTFCFDNILPNETYALNISDSNQTVISDTFFVTEILPPTANFSYMANGLSVNFLDNSLNSPSSWNWNFGDGVTSTLTNPNHVYSDTGSFIVSLVTANQCDTTTYSQIVEVECGQGGLLSREDAILALYANSTQLNLDTSQSTVWCPVNDFGECYGGLLPAGTVITPALNLDSLYDTLVTPSYFFFIDDSITEMFTHPVRYIYVSATDSMPTLSNGGITVKNEEWWAVVYPPNDTSYALYETDVSRTSNQVASSFNPDGLIGGYAPPTSSATPIALPSPCNVPNNNERAIVVSLWKGSGFGNNVKRMTKALTCEQGVPANNIVSHPEGINIEAFCDILDSIGNLNTTKVTIYITTHGGQEQNKKSSFLAYIKKPGTLLRKKEVGYLSQADLKDKIETAFPNVKFNLVVEACHAAGLFWNEADNVPNWVLPANGSKIITSCNTDKVSYWGLFWDGLSPFWGSSFTYSLVACMEDPTGNADLNQNGNTDVCEGFLWARMERPCYNYGIPLPLPFRARYPFGPATGNGYNPEPQIYPEPSQSNANKDLDTTNEDTPVTIDVQANDSISGDPVTTTIATPPGNGTAVVVNGDSITYTPDLNFNGNDTLLYSICDTSTPALCDTDTVIITVNPVNDPPVAVIDYDTTAENTPVTIDVQANDSDPDGDPLTTTIVTPPGNGTAVVVNGDSITYTPDPSFNGTDTLLYSICDNGTPILCDTDTVIITVCPRVQLTYTIMSGGCPGIPGTICFDLKAKNHINKKITSSSSQIVLNKSISCDTMYYLTGFFSGFEYYVVITEQDTVTIPVDTFLVDTIRIPHGDSIPPNAVCQPLTIYLDTNGVAQISPQDLDGGSSDNCGIDSLYTLEGDSFTCDIVGSNNITLVVRDSTGLLDSCSTTLTVIDTIPPDIRCQDLTVQLDPTGNAIALFSVIGMGSSDNCGLASWGGSQFNFDCSDVGTNLLSLTLTDINGNFSTCSTNISVEDNVLPVAACRDDTVYLSGLGIATILPDSIDNGSFDACGIAVLKLDTDTFSCANIGFNTVTMSVWDVNGNVATCTASLGVLDTVAPSVSCPANIMVTDSGQCGAPVFYAATGSDNCSSPTITSSITSGSFFPIGTTQVVFNAVDPSANTDTCSFLVTVNPQPLTLAIVPEVKSNGTNISCHGDSSGLAVAYPGGGCQPYQFLWSNGSTNDSVGGLPAGWVAITVTDSLGATITDSVLLSQPAPLSATLPFVNPVCQGDSTSFSVPLAGGDTTSRRRIYFRYFWGLIEFCYEEDSNGVAQVGPLSHGAYLVTVRDSSGCEFIDSLIIDSLPLPIPMATSNAPLCPTDTLELNAAPNFLTYNWTAPNFQSGQQNPSILPPLTVGSQQYSLQVIDANGCSNQDSITVTVNPNPSVDLGPDTLLCNGQSTVLDAGNPNAMYSWSGGQMTQTITTSLPGTYSVTVSELGCTGSDAIVIDTGASPQVSFMNAPASGNQSYQFTDLSTGTIDNWSWDFGDGNGSSQQNPVHTYNTPGNYMVCLTVSGDCGSDTLCQITSVTELEEEQATSFPLRIYPNPNHGHFWVETDIPFEESTPLTIYDLKGKVVWKMVLEAGESKWSLDLFLPAAVYELVLMRDEKMEARRVMIYSR